MSFLIIDQDKCKRDGICAAECPSKIIVFEDLNSYPGSINGAEQICVSCGHCIAVCPQSAISLNNISSDKFLPLKKDLLPTAEQVEHLLKSRRSIRSFKDKVVDRTILQKLIDISTYAPSAHNIQPVHWLVFEDKNEVHRIAGFVVNWMRYIITNKPQLAALMHMEDIVTAWEQGYDRVCREAPHLIIAHAPKNVAASQGSCTIALTYLELAAYSMGLGACWAGFVGAAAGSFPQLIAALDLPEGHQTFGAMMIGYPKYSYYKIPPRNAARIIWR